MRGKSRNPGVLRVRRMVEKELRQLFRDPKTKRVIFVSPVIQLLLLGYAVNTDVRNVAVALADHDRTRDSRELVDAFTASGHFRIVETTDRGGDLGAALDEGRAVATLEIPSGYARKLRAGRGATVQFLVDGTSSNTATVAQGYAARIVREMGLRQSTHLPPGSLTGSGIDLRARAWYNPSLESRAYNVPAVIGMVVLLMSLLLTAMAVVREREVGTLEQLLVSPLTPTELILGKTLPAAGIAMMQLALVTAVALLWFDVPFRGSIPALVLAASLFILAGLAVGLLISTISRTQQEAFLAMFLFLLPAIILSGLLYPIDTMPSVFRQLTLINPLRHFLEVVRGIFLKGHGFADLGVPFTVLACMAGAGMSVAVARFRRSI